MHNTFSYILLVSFVFFFIFVCVSLHVYCGTLNYSELEYESIAFNSK